MFTILLVQAFKFATYCNPPLCNYLMYMGDTGVYTYTFEYAKKEVGSASCYLSQLSTTICSDSSPLTCLNSVVLVIRKVRPLISHVFTCLDTLFVTCFIMCALFLDWQNCLVCGSEREIKISNCLPLDTLQDVLNTSV